MTWPRRPNRIAPVRAPDAEQSRALAKTPTLPDGTVRNIFATLAHQPVLLERFNAFAGTFMRFGRLTAYEREVVVLRVAATMRCRYELGQHLPLARACGISEETIAALVRPPELARLSASDRLLAAVTDAVIADGEVGDSLWSELAAGFDEGQLVELLCLIGTYRMVADLLNVAGVALEPDLDAAVDALAA